MSQILNPTLEIDRVRIGLNHPTYFIADIAANHDGELNRAIDLIHLAANSGANVAKFQHFDAATIVSDFGFNSLKSGTSHQSKWKKSVVEVYEDATVKLEWTQKLLEACQDAGITFFTSPYSIEIVEYIDQYVPAYKIGSGDITWHDMIKKIASKQKPYLLATGASDLNEVVSAVEIGRSINNQIALLQCNTNYTGTLENFSFIQLNVLKKYRNLFPDLVLGLSDHTPGHSTVLGAVALGARIIEKHFTDDVAREGPDHNFAMDPKTWREMVNRTRELEQALGTDEKKIEGNELETVVLQRRSIRASRSLNSGEVVQAGDLVDLRPCPQDAIPPYMSSSLIGRRLVQDVLEGDYFRWTHVEQQ